ncbi:hypothetical protein JZ751_027790 [Albula glossodonta]|uniref:Uncharacterized protein n=1 Tax=Albula glossodonta TaxID=121402 RepID=A0A8T2PK75_9TELE|nr:hypothetical protein JZ751_027790 [Albula glossodonta]
MLGGIACNPHSWLTPAPQFYPASPTFALLCTSIHLYIRGSLSYSDKAFPHWGPLTVGGGAGFSEKNALENNLLIFRQAGGELVKSPLTLPGGRSVSGYYFHSCYS